MKRVLLATFSCISILSAGEFEEAEALFQRGKFKECEEMIVKTLETKLSAEQKLKLLAMREYIWGNDPDKIAEIVKKTKEISAHQGWLTEDLLNHSTLLIRRAEDWKTRGIPEYQELSNAAAQLLSRLKDSGNPETAIKQVILQTRNLNLNGEYKEPMKLIRDVLHLYYPAGGSANKIKSTGETELLILLGEQYAGLGASAKNEQEKINALSSAAKYYLQAIEHLPVKSRRYRDLSNRLCFCRESLRLLGYNLRLPAKIQPKKSIEVAMFDEILRTRRFHDAVIALESRKNPVLRLRYAFALSAIGQINKAADVIRELKEIPEPHFILLSARNALASNQKRDAACLFQLFLKYSPNGSDTLPAAQQYVSILMEQKEYEKAAAVFLFIADLSTNRKMKDDVQFQAAQCFYESGKYDECIRLFSKIIPSPERMLLLAQAEIKVYDERGALALLQKILKEKSLSDEFRYSVLRLAVFCALKTDPIVARKLLYEVLQQYPNRTEMPEYARHLLNLYLKCRADSDDFFRLANIFFKNAPDHPDMTAFILECAAHITTRAQKEKILKLLLERQDYSVHKLKELLKHLPDAELKREFLNRYKKPFRNEPDLCELYFLMAEVETALKDDKTALTYLDILLSQKEVFRYVACMTMRIEANARLEREESVRNDCQALLLTRLSTSEKRRIVLRLAQSWERSGNLKKAIAVAWTAVPMTKSTEQDVAELLALIIRNAKKIGAQDDLQDAMDLQ